MFFGPMLLNKAEVHQTRDDSVKKISVKRIEEVMADIRINVKKALKQELDFKNATVEARKIFNQHRLRDIYKKNKSMIDTTGFQGLQMRSHFEKACAQEDYAKTIQRKYKRHSNQRVSEILATK